MNYFVLLLALLSDLPNEPTQACEATTAMVERAKRIRYPVVELRADAWGAVIVEFKILPSGTTTDLEPVHSSSSVFERAAIMMVSESRFSKRDDACLFSLLIEFTMKERVWSTEILPAPENLEKFYEEVQLKHKLVYGR